MDLRRPPRDWRKNPPSLTAIVASVAVLLMLGGVFLSRSADVSATPMGGLVDLTRHVRDSTDMIPDILFGAGTAVAGIFILVYILRMRDTDPRKGRYKSD